MLGRRWKGLVILLTTTVLTFLVNWALVNLNIGLVNIGKLVTSWLWIPLILFWVWNVLDAQKSSEGKTFAPLIGLACAGLILYFIAWNVTDVNLDRLVTRFGDAQKMANQLINPELATVTINGQDQTCSWDCLYSYTRDRLAGIKPHLDVRASQNVLDIFGQTQKAAAPAWMVFLGLAQKGQQVNTFVAGKLMETIAIGLMSTLFSTILAVPVSFLAAHNIISRVPGGQAIYYITRTILNIVRAVDTIVWGLIVIVWVGLGTFAGVIAVNYSLCGGVWQNCILKSSNILIRALWKP